MSQRTICNKCGEVIENMPGTYFKLHTTCTYGSKFDGDKLDIDLCAKCADELIEDEFLSCKVSVFDET